MNRKRQDVSTVRISDEEYYRLENKLETLRNEYVICRRKLESKCEALLILSQDLDQCRSERDQFKLMAEQLRERYQSMKKSLTGQPLQSTSDTSIYKNNADTKKQNIAHLLLESRENAKSLQFEMDDLKQKLQDARGDVKLLREQIARQRVGTTDEGMNTRHFPAHEREELVQKLESAHEQYLQLERDLQTVLDEKEELVTARDVYKSKYERLNQELNYILKGDENRVVDIDALVMENKYLQERLTQMEEEKSMAVAAVSKYKSLLEKKKGKSSMKFGQSRGGGMIITQKQVQEVLKSNTSVIPTAKAMSDLQALAGALLDSVNDKNLALSHQRKTNKILGNRVAELEKKIKTLEVAGLWNTPVSTSLNPYNLHEEAGNEIYYLESCGSLEKLYEDFDEMKMMVPRKLSMETDSDKLSTSEGERDSELENVTPLDSIVTSPITSPHHVIKPLSHLELSDLDLLPTKEVREKHTETGHTFIGTDVYGLLPKDFVNSISTKQSETELCTADTCTVSSEGVGDTCTVSSEGVGETCENVHVYNDDQEDKAASYSQSAHVPVNNSDTVDTDISAPEADTDDDFYTNDGAEHSQKVVLLLESVAKKMCNISHHTVDQESSVFNAASKHMDATADCDHEDCASESVCTLQSAAGRLYNNVGRESPSEGCALLQESGKSDDDTSEQTHDVEC